MRKLVLKPMVLSVALVALILAACSGPTAAETEATVISGVGSEVSAKVDEFRSLLGGQNNGGAPGPNISGYREINWDSLPDDLAAPHDYAPDFFNAPDEPRARGMLLSTTGSGLFVSADADNPDAALPRFGNVRPEYADSFLTFSAERLFAPMDSIHVDVTFFVPGTSTPALVRGFGAVYTDVDTLYTALEFFDAAGNSIGRYEVPVNDGGLSFIGAAFPEAWIARVRVQFGTAPLGSEDSVESDVSVMDNFIYGEPQARQ